MEQKNTMKPIPVSYIADHAKAKSTQARRVPYTELIERWAQDNHCEAEALVIISAINGEQMITANHMPKEFCPLYRKGETAERLIEIINRINDKITSGEENWTWAHVMRVMTDEGIIFKTTPNKFDSIICSMIPGKGKDTVRKNGDYTLLYIKEPWSQWTKQSHINPEEAANRMICMMIAIELAPILGRKIALEY